MIERSNGADYQALITEVAQIKYKSKSRLQVVMQANERKKGNKKIFLNINEDCSSFSFINMVVLFSFSNAKIMIF